MSAANVQLAVMKRLEEVLADFPLKTDYNNHDGFKIFKHKLPEQLTNEFDYSNGGNDNALFPFVVVKISDGQKESSHATQVNTVQLVIGVKNEGLEAQGDDDVLACIEAIWQSFNEDPLIEQRYNVLFPMSWALSEEEMHPFYYGGIELKIDNMQMVQVEPFI